MSADAAAHVDPVAPVILGVTSILAVAIIGRITARRLNQPTVLGELIVGILLGNLAWYYGVDLITVLREGPLVFEAVNLILAGHPAEEVAVEIFGEQKVVRDPAHHFRAAWRTGHAGRTDRRHLLALRHHFHAVHGRARHEHRRDEKRGL